jgi:hypothetical protein
MRLPTIDILDDDPNKMVTRRLFTAAVYWTWEVCNNWVCKTPWGKAQFLTYEDYGPDLKFCCHMCHTIREVAEEMNASGQEKPIELCKSSQQSTILPDGTVETRYERARREL